MLQRGQHVAPLRFAVSIGLPGEIQGLSEVRLGRDMWAVFPHAICFRWLLLALSPRFGQSSAIIVRGVLAKWHDAILRRGRVLTDCITEQIPIQHSSQCPRRAFALLPRPVTVQGLGFRAWGSGLGVWGSGFRPGFRPGFRCRVQAGFRVLGGVYLGQIGSSASGSGIHREGRRRPHYIHTSSLLKILLYNLCSLERGSAGCDSSEATKRNGTETLTNNAVEPSRYRLASQAGAD